MSEIVGLVRAAAGFSILFLPHAVRQVVRPDRMITSGACPNCILKGEVIEDYPEDVQGHSCLML